MTLGGHVRRLWALRTGAVGCCAGAVAVLVLHVRDPHVCGAYGVCPFHAVTGLWCPGCGGLRAVNDLTNGNVAAALHSNALVVPLGSAMAVLWGRSMLRQWRGDRRPRGHLGGADNVTAVVLVGLLVVFTIARNTLWGAWLAPV